jgi:hypothetical protein
MLPLLGILISYSPLEGINRGPGVDKSPALLCSGAEKGKGVRKIKWGNPTPAS